MSGSPQKVPGIELVYYNITFPDAFFKLFFLKNDDFFHGFQWIELKKSNAATPGLRKHSKSEALNLPHGHSPRKRPPRQIRKSITKKRKPTLANKTRGMYIRLR
jgi:hypothetical protein